jgi:hypothetical protein
LYQELKEYSKDVVPEEVLANFFKFETEHVPKKRPRIGTDEVDPDWIKAGEITEYFIRDIGVVKMQGYENIVRDMEMSKSAGFNYPG